MVDDADNVYFKRLLDLVPPHFYFNEEAKDMIRNKDDETAELKTSGGKSAKKIRTDPLNSQSVSSLQASLNAMEEKIKGKKDSKQKKKKKTSKEKAGPGINMQEAQERLRARIAELQAKRAQGLSSVEQQEQKRLQRKQRRLNVRSKNKKKSKDVAATASSNQTNDSASSNQTTDAANSLVVKKSKPILNKDGKIVFSKFDFTLTGEKEKHSTSLVGKDYKRLLARLEQRDAKVAKVKEVDPDAAARLEEKHVWQDVLNKAKGEKVKDDPILLKKALKRKEKMQELRKKKWEKRQENIEHQQKQRQDKRQRNIQKRKDEKKAKHRKKLIKKGRILPGF